MVSIDEIIRAITPIIEPSPVRRVTLFGSYAKGTNTLDSDVDMVIDSNGQLKGIDFFVLVSKLAKALPIKSDIFEQREIKMNSAMYNKIVQEGVIIYAR